MKPWLFTEIKESRHWDISSSERMDILRRFCNYGLEHWGSDTKAGESVSKHANLPLCTDGPAHAHHHPRVVSTGRA